MHLFFKNISNVSVLFLATNPPPCSDLVDNKGGGSYTRPRVSEKFCPKTPFSSVSEQKGQKNFGRLRRPIFNKGGVSWKGGVVARNRTDVLDACGTAGSSSRALKPVAK